VVFLPFAVMGPGEVLEYRFALKAERAAAVRVTASATANGLGEPVRKSADLTIQE
jgi:hypothetical protein